MATITTTEYWSVTGPDGTDYPLNTLAYNISTWGDDRSAPPTPRGGNVVVPLTVGEKYVPKMPDARTITLGMWVRGTSDTGSYAPANGQVQQLHNNWAILKFILWNRLGQFQITKRWKDSTNTLQTAFAMAEFAGGMSFSADSPTNGKFTVDLRLADPFFYGTPVNVLFNSALGTSGTNPAVAVSTFTGTILGDYYCRRLSISALPNGVATVSNPRVTITTTPITNYWLYNGTIAASTAIAMDADDQVLTIGNFNAANNVVHSGYPDWLLLNPGTTNLAFTAVGGNWTGTLTYSPTYW